MQRPTRVLAYVRVSSAEQGRSGTSLEGQQEEISRYCSGNSFPSPRFFIEVESAGAEKLERRTQLKSLLNEVKAGDLVAVAKQDRWSRDTLFYLQSTRDIVAKGARFFSLAERFDPQTPEGVFAATIMAAVAEQERARIFERTVLRRKELRATGLWVEGLAPYGYRVKDRRLVVQPDEADVIREVHRLSQAGESLEDIAQRYVDSGVKYWDKQAVHKLLRKRWYLGEMEVTPGVWRQCHEAIIDRVTYDRTQAAMDGRRLGGRKPSEGSRTRGWLGRGLMHCALCGSRMGYAYHGEWGYYRCHGRLRPGTNCEAPFARHEAIDIELGEMVRDRLVAMRSDLAKPPSSAGLAPSRMATIGERLTRLEARRSRLVDMLADGTIGAEEGRQRVAKADAELARTREELAREQAALGRKKPEVRREVLAEVERLSRAWDVAKPDARRKIVGYLAERIEVVGMKVKVTWRT